MIYGILKDEYNSQRNGGKISIDNTMEISKVTKGFIL